MLYQAIECGDGLHSYSPKKLNLQSGTYNWKVWSSDGYGGDGFQGSISVITSTPPAACENIQGTYDSVIKMGGTTTVLGESETVPEEPDYKAVSVSQTDCYIKWDFLDDDGVTYNRSGEIKGNTVHLTGEFANATDISNLFVEMSESEGLYGAKVTIAKNTFTGDGTISGNIINYKCTGYLSGVISYQSMSIPFSISMTENTAMTKR